MLVASIGVADSINPSTIVPALWLASAPRPRRLAFYTLGVFAVYLAGGLVLVLGPGPSLITALHRIQGPVEHALEVAGGTLVLAFAFGAWRSRHGGRTESWTRRSCTRASAFALGAGIMAVELPTAFMYFGAISAILAVRLNSAAQILLLTLYNALFVTPLIALLSVRRLAGHRGDQWVESAAVKLREVGQLVLTTVAGAAGSTLLAVGLAGLVLSS
jgi:cytochrome c biogenesis protein CcdA